MSTTDNRKLLLLGMLNSSKMHGYLLNAHLGSGIPINLKKPTAYNLLDRMEQDGWVAHQDEFTGERCRKVYSLTAKGKTVFHEMLEVELSTFRLNEFSNLVGIGFLDAVPEHKRTGLLRKRRDGLKKYLEIFGAAGDEAHQGSSGLMLKYMQRSLKLELKFLGEMIAAGEAL